MPDPGLACRYPGLVRRGVHQRCDGRSGQMAERDGHPPWRAPALSLHTAGLLSLHMRAIQADTIRRPNGIEIGVARFTAGRPMEDRAQASTPQSQRRELRLATQILFSQIPCQIPVWRAAIPAQ